MIITEGIPAGLNPFTRLRAGAVELSYREGELRYLRADGHEIISRIYSAVRDQNWKTVPGIIRNEKIQSTNTRFLITFDVEHRKTPVDFFWQGKIEGTENGIITFSMDGEARSTFSKNRIGFCILHPMSLAGNHCTVYHPEGGSTDGVFPSCISPHQPFRDIRRIVYTAGSGIRTEVSFSGDIFEMEDQRNWSDASYKTYCTPLSRPFPVIIRKGDRIRQAVRVEVSGVMGIKSVPTEEVTVTYAAKKTYPLPDIGLSAPSHGLALTEGETRLLRMLNLSHYRADIRCDTESIRDSLENAWTEAGKLDLPLEIAVHLGKAPEADIEELTLAMNDIKPSVKRWLVFKQDQVSTPDKWITHFRNRMEGISRNALFVSGTDAFFAELNRGRPDMKQLDGITYSLTPQVHAFDTESLTESIACQQLTVESAKAFSDGKDVFTGPVSFRMRWNPASTEAERPIPAGELPPRVDLRQLSLYGAAWTLGSIASLTAGGSRGITYYETTGWLGVMEREDGSPLPEKFPSTPGTVFPLYFPFLWVGERKGGFLSQCTSSNPLKAGALVVQNSTGRSLILMNYTAGRVVIRVHGLSTRGEAKTLDETTQKYAVSRPVQFSSTPGENISFRETGSTIKLDGFAMMHIAL